MDTQVMVRDRKAQKCLRLYNKRMPNPTTYSSEACHVERYAKHSFQQSQREKREALFIHERKIGYVHI